MFVFDPKYAGGGFHCDACHDVYKDDIGVLRSVHARRQSSRQRGTTTDLAISHGLSCCSVPTCRCDVSVGIYGLCSRARAGGNDYSILARLGSGEGNGGRQVPLRNDRAGRSTSASISFVLFTFAEFHIRFGRNFTGTTSFDILTRFKSPPTQPLRYSRVSGADSNNSLL